jgi:hypothetical protein
MCWQWVRRGRKVTHDNPGARSPITAFYEYDGIAEGRPSITPWMCRDVVGRRRRRLLALRSSNKFNAAPAASFNLDGLTKPTNHASAVMKMILPAVRALRPIPLGGYCSYRTGGMGA